MALADFVAAKMHKMQGEDRPQKQKVAIAYSYARKAGYDTSPKTKRMLDRIFGQKR